MSFYSPIESRQQEIRILHLAPGSFDDEIRMTLKPIYLLDTPSPVYEALSYVWGRELCPRVAHVNNESFTITSNLDTALRHLRRDTEERILWVDAVCINQDDDDEKSLQVQLMRDIYSKATKVTVWMGPADKNSTIFLDCVDEIETTENTDVQEVLEAASGFFSRDWFTRTWVVQEFELASKEPEMLCGFRATRLSVAHFFLCNLHTAFELYWGKKATAQTAGIQQWSPFMQSLASSIIIWCGTATPEAVEDYQREIATRIFSTDGLLSIHQALKCPHGYGTAVNNDQAVTGRGTNQSALFPAVLNRVAHLEATKPVDKIYGILGVCKFEGDAIEPDYTRSVDSVYSQAMAHIMVSGFEHGYPTWPVGMESSKAASYELPSWVPDFSKGSLLHSHAHQDELGGLFRMCDLRALTRSMQGAGRCFPFVAFMHDYQTLYAGGVDIGTVGESWPLWQPGCKASMEKLALIVHQVQQRGVSRDALLDALLGADKSTSTKTAVSSKGDGVHSSAADQSARVDDISGLCQAAASSPARILFLTDNGHVGVTEGSVKPGDLLVGLFGINFPVVLRWINGTFRMVNIAHIAHHELGHENIPRDVTKEDLLEKHGFNIYAIE